MIALVVFILMSLTDCCAYLSTVISHYSSQQSEKTMVHELYLCDMPMFSHSVINLYSPKYSQIKDIYLLKNTDRITCLTSLQSYVILQMKDFSPVLLVTLPTHCSVSTRAVPNILFGLNRRLYSVFVFGRIILLKVDRIRIVIHFTACYLAAHATSVPVHLRW